MVPEVEVILRTITGEKGILTEGLTATAEADVMSKQLRLPAQNVGRNVKSLSSRLQTNLFIAMIVLQRKAKPAPGVLLKETLTSSMKS